MSKQTKARTGECLGFVVVAPEARPAWLQLPAAWEVETGVMPRATARECAGSFRRMDGQPRRIARVVLDK